MRLSGSGAVYSSASGSVWQCVRRQFAAVRLVVYGSILVVACGSPTVQQCAAMCGSARGCVQQSVQHAAMCGSVWLHVAVSTVVSAQCAQCAQQYAAVQLVVCSVCGSAAVRVCQCGSVRQCAAVCGSALCAAVRAAVCGSALGNVRQCRSACVAVR